MRLHKPSIVLTIDEGTIQEYKNLYPLLKEKGICATTFLVGSKIGKMYF